MSAIKTNAGTSNTAVVTLDETTPTAKTEGETEVARDERKATGRSIAIIIFLSVMSLALYHVIQRKTTVLAGVLVPALILFTYLFFVIHVSQREKEKRRNELETVDTEISVQSESKKPGLSKKNSTLSIPSISSASLPSTSVALNSMRNIPKKSLSKSSSLLKMDLKGVKMDPTGVKMDPTGVKKDPTGVKMDPSKVLKKPRPFVKAPSQSNIQVRNYSAHIAIEHEKKKLKKSRSFDKNNFLLEENKKFKTKN